MLIDEICGKWIAKATQTTKTTKTTDDQTTTTATTTKSINDQKLDNNQEKNMVSRQQRMNDTKNDERLDPFIAYEKDGYEYPDLQTEIMEMLQSNLIIYPLADLRDIARKEQLEKTEDEITPLPTKRKTKRKKKKNDNDNSNNAINTSNSKDDTESDTSSNNTPEPVEPSDPPAPYSPSVSASSVQRPKTKKKWHEAFDSDDENERRIPISKCLHLPMKRKDVVRLIGQNMEKFDNKHRIKNYELLKKYIITHKNSIVSPTTIIAIDDQYAKHELVYTIEVNKQRKCVIVCFRGSITKNDWATDFEIYMKEVKNPMGHYPEQESTVKIHNGFHDYLFEPNERGVKGPSGEDLSEYQEILQQHVIPILKQYPGYKLYVTGHSLGAALATLFGYEAAAEPDNLIPKPVSLFSIASPYVGDESFRSSHQLLESLGKLRHLRLSNQQDLITTVPKMSFRFNMFAIPSPHVGTLFKHVGMNLRLLDSKNPPMEFSYPTVYKSSSGGWFYSRMDELGRGWNQSIFKNLSWNPLQYFNWSWHSLVEYDGRLQRNHAVLHSIYLNELYSRKDLVGNLVAQF